MSPGSCSTWLSDTLAADARHDSAFVLALQSADPRAEVGGREFSAAAPASAKSWRCRFTSPSDELTSLSALLTSGGARGRGWCQRWRRQARYPVTSPQPLPWPMACNRTALTGTAVMVRKLT
jgi:hypothetical protein